MPAAFRSRTLKPNGVVLNKQLLFRGQGGVKMPLILAVIAFYDLNRHTLQPLMMPVCFGNVSNQDRASFSCMHAQSTHMRLLQTPH